MRIVCIPSALVLVALMVAKASAVLPDRSPENLRESASHVITGKVKAVYKYTEKNAWEHRRHFVAAVQVTQVEKGDRIQNGDLVYVRYWRVAWQREPIAGPAGQHEIPKVGQVVSAYVERAEDGGYDVLEPNGFQFSKTGQWSTKSE